MNTNPIKHLPIDKLSNTFDDDEESGSYKDVPVPSTKYVLLKSSSFSSSSNTKPRKLSNYNYWATSTLSIIQISTFATMIYVSGFVSLHSNPFLGPSLHVIDRWGSKNPSRIIEHGEYWRLVLAIFFNVGLADLLFSICVLICLGYHIEKRWGGLKFLIVYVLSGICGNVFATLYAPSAVSVGSGGCIFGLLGAMHVDIVFSIIHGHLEADDRDDDDKDNEEEEEEEHNDDDALADSLLLFDDNDSEQNRNEKPNQKLQDRYILRSTYIILGFLGGVSATTLMGFFYPQSLRIQKDWAVLYGGMISGLIVGLVWQLCESLRARERDMTIRVLYGFLIVVVPFLFDCFFSLELSHSIF